MKRKYSLGLRLWHWINVIVIAGSLITVLLNSTLFDVRNNANYIKDELQKTGVTVSPEQARSVSHGMEDNVWQIHIYFGYALAGLFLFRILYGFFSRSSPGLMLQLKAAYHLYIANKIASTRHELAIKVFYLIFYIVILIMCITGLSVAFDENIGISRSLSHSLKEIHGFCMYIILGFIVLHIGGVWIAEQNNKKGIVSDMINGGNNEA